MKVDTSEILLLEAEPVGWGSVLRLAGLAAIIAAVAAGNYAFNNSVAAFVSVLLALFILSFVPLAICHVRQGTRAKLKLSPTGLSHSGLKDGEIPWSVIRDAEVWRSGKFEAVLLKLSGDYLRRRNKTLVQKLTRRGNQLMSGDGILIPPRPFNRSVDELRDLIKAYAYEHTKGTPQASPK